VLGPVCSYQVQRLTDGQTYALKEMDVRAMSQVEREDAVNEIRLLASVQNPNVIRYNEAFLDGNKVCIIMEYAPGGDLSKVIKCAPPPSPPS
jgi:serine/threonine protein kinase